MVWRIREAVYRFFWFALSVSTAELHKVLTLLCVYSGWRNPVSLARTDFYDNSLSRGRSSWKWKASLGHHRTSIWGICQGEFSIPSSVQSFPLQLARLMQWQLNYIVEIIYNPTMFFTKASILLFYLRAFNPVRSTCVILHIVLWTNFTFYLVAIIVEAFQCLPVRKAWLPLMSGHCINQRVAQTSSAAINTFSDCIILVVPLAKVWGLQLYRKGRVGLVMIFGFGLLYVQSSSRTLHIHNSLHWHASATWKRMHR